MSKTNKTEEPKQEKVMTKYDRKVQQRKLQEEKDKRDNLVSKIIAIAVAVVLVGAIVISVGISVNNRNRALKDTYVTIGEHEVTGLEYDFYYHTMVTNYLNAYSAFIPYMGLDVTKDFAEQTYDENMTWKDAFDKMTVEQLQEVKAIVDDAKAAGFAYETEEEDYKTFQEGFAKQAEKEGVAVSEYYKTMFGKYATEERLAPFVKDTLLVTAYTNKLLEDNKPSDEEITAHYEANKQNYDLMDYRMYSFTADVTEESTDKEIEVAMEALAKKAEIMKADRLAGEEFQALCDKYDAEKATAEDTEEEDTEAEDTEEATEKNLIADASYNAISTLYADWLYDEARQAGDIEIFKDETNNKYYVVEFVERTYNEDTNTKISNEIASGIVNEHVEGLIANYGVTDVAGELVYLTKPEPENPLEEESAEASEEEVTEEATEEADAE